MAYRQDQIFANELRADTVFKLGKGNGETLGAARTVVDGEGPILAFDAGGSSRNVTLPARAAVNDGVVLFINNISTAGENLTIKNSAATTLATLPSAGVALVFATVLDETPGTRAWRAAIIGGEDMAIADDLVVTDDLTVGGDAAITSTLVVGSQASFSSNMILDSTLTVAKQGSFTSNVVVASTLGIGKNATFSSAVQLGTATSNLVGFYNGTGISQRASSLQDTANVASSTDFSTNHLNVLKEIMTTLVSLGVWKGAA